MLDVSGADDHHRADRANRWRAHLFLNLRSGDDPGWHCSYYASGEFRSERGRHAAHMIGDELARVVADKGSGAVSGVAFSILRETSMAAVVCALADGTADHLAAILTRSAEIGVAIGTGVRRAFEEPLIVDPPTVRSK